MFDHVTIRVSDGAASERFYDTVLDSLGLEKTGRVGQFGDDCPEFAEWSDFSIAEDAQNRTTGLHVGFCAWSHEDVDRFWQTGVDAGYGSDGEPGMRPEYGDTYYGGFLLDPDGNSIEACFHDGLVRRGNVDHLWIRVEDLDAGAEFYELIAPYSGFPLHHRPVVQQRRLAIAPAEVPDVPAGVEATSSSHSPSLFVTSAPISGSAPSTRFLTATVRCRSQRDFTETTLPEKSSLSP